MEHHGKQTSDTVAAKTVKGVEIEIVDEPISRELKIFGASTSLKSQGT